MNPEPQLVKPLQRVALRAVLDSPCVLGCTGPQCLPTRQIMQRVALQALHDFLEGTLARQRQPLQAHAQPRMDMATGAALLANGLQQVASITKHSCNAQNQQQKANLTGELQQWLSRLPLEMGQQTLSNVTAELILVFMKVEWAPHHGKTLCPDGSLGPAAKALQNAVSALSTTFAQMGRSRPWNSAAPATCNPCSSEPIKSFMTGYHQMLAASGQEAKGAIPFSEDKVARILGRLLAEAMEPVRMGQKKVSSEQLLAARDGMAFAFAWAGACRCINSCELRLENVTVQATGQPAHPLLFQQSSLPAIISPSRDSHLCHSKLPAQTRPRA